MKKVFIISFILVSNFLFSQTTITTKISGMVADSNYYPLPYSTISFLQNNKLKYGAICDSLGFYKIDSVKPGRYIFKVSCIGYKPFTKDLVIDSTKQKQIIKPVILKANIEQLQTIEIKANKTGYYSYVDKSVFYPDSNILKSSKNAIDVIKKVPEIKVDKRNTNKIKVLGNPNVLVMVNGVYNNRALNAITPDEIEKIEVITHPSAKYRSDVASVVNIVLKNTEKQGIDIYSDFSVCLHQKNHMAFTQISYNYKKMRFFINYHAFFSKMINRDTTKGTENQSKYLSFSINDPRFDYDNQTFQYGFDFVPNKTLTISFTGDFKYRKMINDYAGKTIYELNDTVKNDEILFTNITKDDNLQQNYSVYLKKDFNKKNKLEFATNLYFLNNTTNSDFENKNSANSNNIYKNTIISKQEQSSLNSKIDYTHSFSDKFKIESGYQLYSRNIKTNVNNNNNISNLKYIDYRNSVYANGVVNFNKSGIQSGLRIENFNIALYDSIKNDYTKYLPFFTFNYSLNKNSKIKFNYNQRLSYPTYYQLNPYTYFSPDSININSGNPYLLPETSHNINTYFSFNKKNTFASILLEYRNINNIIVESLYSKNSIIYSKYKNLGKADKYICDFSFSTTIFDFLDIDADIYLAYNTFYNRKEYNGFSYYSEISFYMPIFWDIDFDLSIILQEKNINYNGYELTNTMIDEISLSKYILNDYFIIGFSVWEPFLKAIDKEKRWTDTYSEEVYSQMLNNTCYMFNLTFMFNKGKKSKKIKKESLMEDNFKEMK